MCERLELQPEHLLQDARVRRAVRMSADIELSNEHQFSSVRKRGRLRGVRRRKDLLQGEFGRPDDAVLHEVERVPRNDSPLARILVEPDADSGTP